MRPAHPMKPAPHQRDTGSRSPKRRRGNTPLSFFNTGGKARRAKPGMLFLTALLLLTMGSAVLASPKEVTAGHVKGRIKLDGVLDEPAWREAGIIDNLTQQEPHPGEPTPFHTEVRILVDEGNLYVGFICTDPEPRKIAVHTLQRDADMQGDDTVGMVLDTFGDRRRGYFFRINAAGARQDGLISDRGRPSADWDGIWDARTRRTREGWTAEIRIPAQTLHFTAGHDRWGFNVERQVARNQLTLRWKGITFDSKAYDLRRAGWLNGVGELHQGLGLSVSPYALGRTGTDYTPGGRVWQGDFGGDITYNLTPDLTGVLTINTDFAETEVDTRKINLTRFPLFFPEKRAFFLEGSELFSFGSGLSREFIPFFSRRIGLYQGRQVPINAGVKVLGQTGRWGVAVLDTGLRQTELTRATNLFAGRVTYDVDRHLTIGAIGTNGNPDGIRQNTLMGIDALWKTSTFRGNKNLVAGAWVAGTGGDVSEGRRTGWGVDLEYPNDRWEGSVGYKEFGDGLDPALGFLPRPGTRWLDLRWGFRPRPSGRVFGWVRTFHFQCYFNRVASLDGQTQSWRLFTAPFNAHTESGGHIEANIVPQFEHLDYPFEIVDGVIIPPGDYNFVRFRTEAQSSDHRPWQVGSTVWYGGFYDGSLVQWSTYAGWTSPGGHLQLRAENEYDTASLPGGDFIQRLWQAKIVYSFTPNLSLSSYTQYDSESRNLGMNNRLRWTLKPGNDFYIVWNHGWQQPIGSIDRYNFRPIDDRLVVKLRWTFRK